MKITHEQTKLKFNDIFPVCKLVQTIFRHHTSFTIIWKHFARQHTKTLPSACLQLKAKGHLDVAVQKMIMRESCESFLKQRLHGRVTVLEKPTNLPPATLTF